MGRQRLEIVYEKFFFAYKQTTKGELYYVRCDIKDASAGCTGTARTVETVPPMRCGLYRAEGTTMSIFGAYRASCRASSKEGADSELCHHSDSPAGQVVENSTAVYVCVVSSAFGVKRNIFRNIFSDCEQEERTESSMERRERKINTKFQNLKTINIAAEVDNDIDIEKNYAMQDCYTEEPSLHPIREEFRTNCSYRYQ